MDYDSYTLWLVCYVSVCTRQCKRKNYLKVIFPLWRHDKRHRDGKDNFMKLLWLYNMHDENIGRNWENCQTVV